jgi:hypothetical protein
MALSLYTNGILSEPYTVPCRYVNDTGNLCIISRVLLNRRGHEEYEKSTGRVSIQSGNQDRFLELVFAFLHKDQVERLLNSMLDSTTIQEGDVVTYDGAPHTIVRAFDGHLALLSSGSELVLTSAVGFTVHDTNPEWRTIWGAVEAEANGQSKFGYYLRIPAVGARIRLRKLRPCVACARPTKLQCPNVCGTKFCDSCWSGVSETHLATCVPGLCATCALPCYRQCSGCHRVPYCSVTCQKTNWPVHRVECAVVV